MKCQCVSCLISRALNKGKIPKLLADAFLLGYHYYGMTHSECDVDAGWHAEGVEFYGGQEGIKPIADIVKQAEQKDK